MATPDGDPRGNSQSAGNRGWMALLHGMGRLAHWPSHGRTGMLLLLAARPLGLQNLSYSGIPAAAMRPVLNMKPHEVISALEKIERDIWRLKNARGVRHAKWLVVALKSLQSLAKGIREAVDHATNSTE